MGSLFCLWQGLTSAQRIGHSNGTPLQRNQRHLRHHRQSNGPQHRGQCRDVAYGVGELSNGNTRSTLRQQSVKMAVRY